MAKEREVGIRLAVKDKDVVERALKSLGKEGEATFRRMQKSIEPASTSLLALNAATGKARAGMGTFLAGATAGLAPLLTLTGLIAGVRSALEKFGDIADQSKSAGIDPEFFQGIGYSAKLAGIEIEQTAQALATYAKNAGDAAAGRGRMTEALKKLDPELLRNILLSTSQEEKIRLATDALNKLQSTAEKAALSNALFGNDEFWKGLEGGSAKLDATIERAKELGIVIERDVIEKADEMGDQLDIATGILDSQFKVALLNLAPALVDFAGWLGEIAIRIRDIVESWKGIEELSVSGLDRRMTKLSESDLGLERRQMDVQSRLSNPSWLDQINQGALQAELKKIEDERAALQAEQADILKRYDELMPPLQSSDQLQNRTILSGGAKKEMETIDLLAGKIDKVKTDAELIADDLIKASEQWGERLGDALGDAFRTGKFEWQDLFNGILSDIAKLATKRLISDPLGQLLSGVAGSLFGGGSGFAPATGYVPSFGASWETGGWTGGTRGKIAGAVHGEEFVVKAGPAAANRAMLEALNAGGQVAGGGGMTVNMPITYNIDGNGLDQHQLLAVLDENNKAVLRQVPAAWKKAYKYGAFG